MHIFKKMIWILPAAVTVLVFSVYILIYLYNKSPIVCSDIGLLGNLLRIDFSNAEIVNIRSNVNKSDDSTMIVLCLKADADYLSDTYFDRTNRSKELDPKMEWLPAGDIEVLDELTFDLSSITQYGLSYSEVRNGMSIAPFEIRWYAIDNQLEKNANLIFITYIPRQVKVSMSIGR